MADSDRARVVVVILAVVASVGLGAGYGVWAAGTPPTGPCSWSAGGRDYCTQSLTISDWCPWGAPCNPTVGNETTLLGYHFGIFSTIDRNGTPDLSVTITGDGPEQAFDLYANPLGTPVGWTSADRAVIVYWPSPIPEADWGTPGSTTVICGALPAS